jgi:integrase
MYSKGSGRKATAGSIKVKDSNNRLQLVFTHGGKRHYISLGLTNTPINRKLAQEQAFQIQRDIEYGEFDPTYERYRVQSALTTVSPPSTIPVSLPKLPELWARYVKAKRSGKSPATIRMYGWVTNHLDRCPYKLPNEPQAVFDWLVSNIPADSAKRVMMHLSACCKWAKKSGLIDSDPFYGMASEIKLKKASNEEMEINPFSREERDRIIAAFKSNRYYRHYAPLVEFLFFTGCRPSEALALQWKHITSSAINFEQALIYSGKLVLKEGLKTQKARKFPINTQLSELLYLIKPTQVNLDALIFPSPKNKFIDWHNFTNRAWKSVLATLPDIEYRNPYQTRHTFCSLCREADIASLQIAKWVGNSAAMIDRVYAKAVDYIQVPNL